MRTSFSEGTQAFVAGASKRLERLRSTLPSSGHVTAVAGTGKTKPVFTFAEREGRT